MPETETDSVTPAQLSYLAIYNPSLGPTDETLEDQILYYTSKSSDLQETNDATAEEDGSKPSENDKNERLRQIGLAQGMVNFASNFSSGKPLEYIETDKARVVVLELEKDWWIVASIDLTRLPVDPAQTSSTDKTTSPSFQYSSREMGPPQLLIQQLRRAHSLFLLLHDFSMAELYNRVGRSSFCLFLERFWEKFTWNWELLLSGNPIVDMYNGIKLAAGGELGIGVGEEEWGSGEREVLEDFIARTDGLLDLVVSRFGDLPTQAEGSSPAPAGGNENAWLGSDADPRPADGVVFSGAGVVDRRSLAQVSHWMEWIYRYGDAAYGIGRDPSSLRRRKPRRKRARAPVTPDRAHTPGIPRPLVMAMPQPPPNAHKENSLETGTGNSPTSNDQEADKLAFGTDTVMKYLTLGYGSAWSFSNKSAPVSSPSSPPPESSPAQPGQPTTGDGKKSENLSKAVRSLPASKSQPDGSRGETTINVPGRFVLGPRDDLDTLDDIEEGSPESEVDAGRPRSRIVHRSIHICLADSQGEKSTKKLQAVIYVHQPFMFTFLFDPDTPALSSPALYSSIHHQLGPLQKPLLSSTSPTTAASRMSVSEAGGDPSKRFSTRSLPVYDIVYDPSNLTIRSSIPNIPSLGTPTHPKETSQVPRSPSPSPSRSAVSPSMSRVESIAIHQRLLSTYIDTRPRLQELERTCKTSRGWWIVWVRIPPANTSSHRSHALSSASSSVALSTLTEDNQIPGLALPIPESQEAFIVRRASDYVSSSGHARMSSGARFFRDLGGASSSKLAVSRTDNTPSKLVEGLGMDARRYIEGLLSLNR
ncbi:hypothetical protein PEBR_32211 [Penicillium brasilianum]|uniref:CCZ1/INTU/HSP4 first Longin domain-containing protein n=1 Tax=Penicillium brasilianum TaxID=104259 RepID=A0A1S9REM2_PENBI|nr:hypothetical protein PEBR_32211 [Penicillium brasilianum]